MCRWPLRAPNPLQSILWPIIDPILVTFGQISKFCDPSLVTFYFYEMMQFLDWMKDTLLFLFNSFRRRDHHFRWSSERKSRHLQGKGSSPISPSYRLRPWVLIWLQESNPRLLVYCWYSQALYRLSYSAVQTKNCNRLLRIFQRTHSIFNNHLFFTCYRKMHILSPSSRKFNWTIYSTDFSTFFISPVLIIDRKIA